MSYLVLARKYRPQTFDDVIGQEQITNGLKVALAHNRVHHAYLFCGPRGTGKTTCARILARELNKVKAEGHAESLDIDSNLDIIEIDGASNRGIDEIRTLRENVQFVPMSGHYKIYIVDEVHMLTTEAFNALLKTLEEPPSHVKFIFATTDPNKLPLTVASRCQRCDFKRIPLELMVKSLKSIADKEGFKVEDDALYAVAKAAQGSMRDALSVLDQLISYSDGTVRSSDVNAMLGLVETQFLFDLADALAVKDCAKAFEILEAIISRGKDVKQFNLTLVEHFRHLMVMKVGGDKLQSLVDYPKAQKEALFVQAGKFTMQEIIEALELFIEAQDTARITESARLSLELALAKVTAADVPVPTQSSKPVAAPIPKPAVKPAQAPVASPKPFSPSPTASKNPLRNPEAKPTPPSGQAFIKNDKGFLGAPASAEAGTATALADRPLAIESIKRDWNALTHAVSQEKISTGTFLQEGCPLRLEGQKLVIAFSTEHAFYKECLSKPDALNLIAVTFSKILNTPLIVELETVENAVREETDQVSDARGIFNGEVVNEWHNEE
ncbi:MAG: DNA polymerase III subunit gamma/tau [Candidatus Omnitrophica bacterium]|nr:DNA polymerase III subunit gamma/tau [Candidatus Omnitrophota bacterium]